MSKPGYFVAEYLMFYFISFNSVVKVMYPLQAQVIRTDPHVVRVSHQRVELCVYVLDKQCHEFSCESPDIAIL